MSECYDAINAYDESGFTPLLSAVFIGDLEAVHVLLEQGADPNKPMRDEPRATPLWYAQEDFGLTEISSLLKEFGAGLD